MNLPLKQRIILKYTLGFPNSRIKMRTDIKTGSDHRNLMIDNERKLSIVLLTPNSMFFRTHHPFRDSIHSGVTRNACQTRCDTSLPKWLCLFSGLFVIYFRLGNDWHTSPHCSFFLSLMIGHLVVPSLRSYQHLPIGRKVLSWYSQEVLIRTGRT